MKVLEDRRGAGVLILPADQVNVTYGLTVTQGDGWKTGVGQIIGPDAALHQASMSDKCSLDLGDGRIAPIIVTEHFSGRGLAEFKLAGAIT